MALNPNGITIPELADIIRRYYPDQYTYVDDDDLIGMFKNNPETSGMLDWDNVINEPTGWNEERRERWRKEATDFNINQLNQGASARRVNDMFNTVHKFWGLGGRFGDWATGKLLGPGYEEAKESEAAIEGGLTDVIGIATGRKDLDIVDFFPDRGRALFEGKDSPTLGMGREEVNQYYNKLRKDTNFLYFTPDVINTELEKQKNYIQSVGIPQKGAQGHGEYINLIAGITDVESLIQGAKEGSNINSAIAQGILKQNEVNYIRFVNAIEGKWNSAQEHLEITNQPYHHWERNFTQQTWEELSKQDVIKSQAEYRKVIDADPKLKAIENWQRTQPDVSMFNKAGKITADGLLDYMRATAISLPPALLTAAVGGNWRNALGTGVGLTFGLQHQLQTTQTAMDYLTTDREIDVSEYNSRMDAHKKELQSKNLTQSQVERELSLYERNNFIESQDRLGNPTYILQGLNAGDAWYTSKASVYAGTYTVMVTENLGFRYLSKVFGGSGKKLLGKTFANNMLPKIADTIRKIPGSKAISRISQLHQGMITPVFYAAAIEGTEEAIQYTTQIAAETNKMFGYKEEGFADEFDWNEFGWSIWGGVSVGGVLGTAGSVWQNTGMRDRVENWRRARNKADFFQSYVKKNKETGRWESFVGSPNIKLDDDGNAIKGKDGFFEEEGYEEQELTNNDGTKKDFGTFNEAFEASNQHNRQFAAWVSKQSPEVFKDYIGAKTVIKKLNESKYLVDVVAANGNLINSYTFKNSVDAVEFQTNEDNFISSIDVSADENKDITARAQGDNRIITYENPDGTGEVIDIDEDALFIAGFLGKISDRRELDAYNDLRETEDFKKNISSPKKVLEIIKNKGWDLLNQIGMSKPDLMSSMERVGWNQNFPELVEEIDTLLETPTDSDVAIDITEPIKVDEDVTIEREDIPVREEKGPVEREDIGEFPEEESIFIDEEIEPTGKDERYKDVSDRDLKNKYLEEKAKGGINREVARIRAELKIRGLPIPKVTKKKKVLKKVPKEVLDIDKTMGLEQYNALKKWYDAGKPIRDKALKMFTKDEMFYIDEHMELMGKEEAHGMDYGKSALETYFEGKKTTPYNPEKIKDYTDEELLGYLAAERDKGGVSFNVPKIITELKSRGVEVPKKKPISKQRVLDTIKDYKEKRKKETITSFELIQQEKERFTQEAIEFLTDKFQVLGKGIKFEMVSREDQDKPDKQLRGWYDQATNTVWINPKLVKRDTAFHEIAHPLVNALMKNSDYEIVTEEGSTLDAREYIIQVYKDLIETDKGKDIYMRVYQNYVVPGDFEEGSDAFIEEVLAFGLGEAARDAKISSDAKHNAKGWVNILKRIWSMFKRIFAGKKEYQMYNSTLDFVKDGMTFGSLVDFIIDENTRINIKEVLTPVSEERGMNYTELLQKGLIIEDKKFEKLYEQYYGESSPKVVIESSHEPADSSPEFIKSKRVYPIFQNILREERKKFGTGPLHKDDAYILTNTAIKKLFKLYYIPASVYGSKKVAKKLQERINQLQKEFLRTDEEGSPIAGHLENDIRKFMLHTRMKEFEEYGLTTDIENALHYLLTELSLNYKGVDAIRKLLLNKQYEAKGITLGEFKDWTNSIKRADRLDSRNRVAMNDFIREVYKNKNNKERISLKQLEKDYTKFVEKNYAVHSGISISQMYMGDPYSPVGALNEDYKKMFINEEGQVTAVVDEQRIHFFTGAAISKAGHDVKFAANARASGRGWYRIQRFELPNGEVIYVAHEFQTDMLSVGKDPGSRMYGGTGFRDSMWQQTLVEYLENPDAYINLLSLKNKDKSNKPIIAYDFLVSTMLGLRNIDNVGWNGRYKGLDNLPASLKIINVTPNKEVVNKLIDRFIERLDSGKLTLESLTNYFPNLQDMHEFVNEYTNIAADPGGLAKLRGRIMQTLFGEPRILYKGIPDESSYGLNLDEFSTSDRIKRLQFLLLLEYQALVEEGKGTQDNKMQYANSEILGLMARLYSDITTDKEELTPGEINEVRNYMQSNLKYNTSNVLGVKFNKDVYTSIATGKAPKILYDTLISLNDKIKKGKKDGAYANITIDNVLMNMFAENPEIKKWLEPIYNKYKKMHENYKNKGLDHVSLELLGYHSIFPAIGLYDSASGLKARTWSKGLDLFTANEYGNLIGIKTKKIKAISNNKSGTLVAKELQYLLGALSSYNKDIRKEEKRLADHRTALRNANRVISSIEDGTFGDLIHEYLSYVQIHHLREMVPMFQAYQGLIESHEQLKEDIASKDLDRDSIEDYLLDKAGYKDLFSTIKNMYSLQNVFNPIRILHYIQTQASLGTDTPIHILLGNANGLIQSGGIGGTAYASAWNIYKTKQEDAWHKYTKLVKSDFIEGNRLLNELRIIHKDIKKDALLLDYMSHISEELSETDIDKDKALSYIYDILGNKNRQHYGQPSMGLSGNDVTLIQDAIIKAHNKLLGKGITLNAGDAFRDYLQGKSIGKEMRWLDNIQLDNKIKITGQNSVFVKDAIKLLGELEKKGFIEVNFVVPEWGNSQAIEIKIKDKESLMNYKTYRMQKVIDEESIDNTTPSTTKELQDKVKRKVRYQKIENPRLSNNAAINRIFREAWYDINIQYQQQIKLKVAVSPERFRIAMLEALDTNLHDRFIAWYDVNFSEYSDLKYRNKAKGKDIQSMIPQEDTLSSVVTYLNEVNKREGHTLEDLISKQESDERELSINDFAYLPEFGVHVDANDAVIMNKMAFDIIKDIDIPVENKFRTWMDKALPLVNKRWASLTDEQKRNSLKKYNRLFSSVAINTEHGKYNERDNYIVIAQTKPIYEKGKFIGTQIVKLKMQLKGPDNLSTNSKNNSTDKVTLFEMNNEKGLFSWINGKDFLEPGIMYDADGYPRETYVTDRETGEETLTKKKGLKPRYQFFTYDELLSLDKMVRKSGFAIALTRGDSNKIALVKIQPEHRDWAGAFDAWFSKEVREGFIPEEDKAIHKKNLKSGDISGNIAVHEALKKVFPNYLSIDAATVIKRFKLPFTPMTISQSMPNVSIYIANKENLVFKYKEKTNKGWQIVKGVGNLYIGDGGSITARQLFQKFEKHHGLAPNQVKAKTVIYKNENDEGIAIKHQHYQPEIGIEIWDGDILLAKVDTNGNFIEGVAAGVDMIVTEDEAKWMYGDNVGIGSTVSISGQNIGFTKYADTAVPNTANHMMQWYNHITDPNIISQFKSIILTKVRNDVIEIYRDFSDTDAKRAAKRVGELISKIDVNSPTGFRNTLVELNKLGFIWQLEPMLDVLYQTKKMTPALKLKNQKGSKADLVPNLRGDLKPGEAALSKANGEEVLLKFATAKGISLAQAKKAKLGEVNDWLEENPVYMYIARSPIPHAGGAMMIRIKRLFGRKGIVEMHPFDVFARLEGDYDGDWISLEMLPYTYEKGKFVSTIEDSFIEFFKNLKVKGINLGDFDSSINELVLSRKEDRFKIMEAMTFNKQGEIVNVQALYGLLSQTIESINIVGIGPVVLKSPNEKVKFNVGKIDGKSPTFTISELLRIYLQAGVDNAKFMLLQEWGYTQAGLQRALFEYGKGHPQAGQTISVEAYTALVPYINFLKKAQRIRNGMDLKIGRFNMTRTIAESKKYYEYLQDRDNYIKYSDEIAAEHLTVNFKSTELTPLEEIAILPYEQYVNWMKKFNVIGTQGSPIKIHYNVHRNAHDAALNHINLKVISQSFLAKSLIKDEKAGIVTGKKSSWAKGEWKKGEKYGQKMAHGFHVLMHRNAINNHINSSQPSFIERNDIVVQWKEKFDVEYKDLSEVAKVAATYYFLSGVQKEEQRTSEAFGTKAPRWMPPASKSALEYQLLNENVLSKFAEVYNNQVAKNRNLESRFDSINDLMIEEAIEEACK